MLRNYDKLESCGDGTKMRTINQTQFLVKLAKVKLWNYQNNNHENEASNVLSLNV